MEHYNDRSTPYNVYADLYAPLIEPEGVSNNGPFFNKKNEEYYQSYIRNIRRMRYIRHLKSKKRIVKDGIYSVDKYDNYDYQPSLLMRFLFRVHSFIERHPTSIIVILILNYFLFMSVLLKIDLQYILLIILLISGFTMGSLAEIMDHH